MLMVVMSRNDGEHKWALVSIHTHVNKILSMDNKSVNPLGVSYKFKKT